MWLKWFPWRMVIRNAAKRHGFLDPLELISRLQNFAQPSEVAAPLELLKAGAVFHARGLINSQAIQHNLDWIWPYWVERQFDPADESFIPRAFSLTHVNLTHRNWTAVGLPDTHNWPIVDPAGLVTPFYDGWSIDFWVIPEEGRPLIPSRCGSRSAVPAARSAGPSQRLNFEGNLTVHTAAENEAACLEAAVAVEVMENRLCCRIRIKGRAVSGGRLVVSVRPYNPEGVSFVHTLEPIGQQAGWRVNGKQEIRFNASAEQLLYSDYSGGDVYKAFLENHSGQSAPCSKVICNVGMATGAAVFELKPEVSRELEVQIPLEELPDDGRQQSGQTRWKRALEHHCRLEVPDEKIRFLYDAAVRTLVLHSPDLVYPGPYTYRRFWFRDAAFILQALLCAHLPQRAKRVLDHFPGRQTPTGYFLSQEGEWDSNGEALWAFHQYCLMTGEVPDPAWKKGISKGAEWILRKRLPNVRGRKHAGLFPAGFSAEHLGPNDYYYWDDFWGIAGLKAAAGLFGLYGDRDNERRYAEQAVGFFRCIEKSLATARERLNRPAMPAAPERRMDAGAIGSIVAGYPLQLFGGLDPRLTDTVDFLLERCSYGGGFFQEMTHSGLNPYLTLHLAQQLLRAGDGRYQALIQTVADMASPTGQWPEAVHPKTGGGCMGDGQHVWAAAEWVMMIRNCFVREELKSRKLILCSGLPEAWLKPGVPIRFGPALTTYGTVSLEIHSESGRPDVRWTGDWHGSAPEVEIAVR